MQNMNEKWQSFLINQETKYNLKGLEITKIEQDLLWTTVEVIYRGNISFGMSTSTVPDTMGSPLPNPKSRIILPDDRVDGLHNERKDLARKTFRDLLRIHDG